MSAWRQGKGQRSHMYVCFTTLSAHLLTRSACRSHPSLLHLHVPNLVTRLRNRRNASTKRAISSIFYMTLKSLARQRGIPVTRAYGPERFRCCCKEAQWLSGYWQPVVLRSPPWHWRASSTCVLPAASTVWRHPIQRHDSSQIAQTSRLCYAAFFCGTCDRR